MTIKDYIDRLKHIDVIGAMQTSITENEVDIIFQVRYQMLEGRRGDGTSFRNENIANNVPGGWGTWDDLWEYGGDKHFQTSMKIINYTIISTDWKTPYILESIGEEVMYIDTESNFYKTYLLPKIKKTFYKILKE